MAGSRKEQPRINPEPYFNITKKVYFASLLKRYAEKLKINEKSNASLIDIGCGTGEELVHHIIPSFPKDKIVKFVGGDKVALAVDNANRKFQSMDESVTPSISFVLINIEALIVLHSGQYDYVTSFWCMHLVQDQFRALRNMHRLLKPGGCLLMSFVMKSVLFDVLSALSKYPKYERYIRDVSIGISPYQYSINPKQEIIQYLKDAGFDANDFEVNLENTVYSFETREIYDVSIRSLNAFHNTIPMLMHDEFYGDCLNEFKKRQYITIKSNGSFTCRVPSLVVEVCARRTPAPNPAPEPKEDTYRKLTPIW